MIKYIAAAIVIAFILYMCFKIFTSGADIQSSIDEKRKELDIFFILFPLLIDTKIGKIS